MGIKPTISAQTSNNNFLPKDNLQLKSSLSQKITHFFLNFLEKLKNLFTDKAQANHEPSKTFSPTIPSNAPPTICLAQRSINPAGTERERRIWEAKMDTPFKNSNTSFIPFIDLNKGIDDPGMCSATDMPRIPQIGHYQRDYAILPTLAAIKLPIRQLEAFPDAIKREFVNYDANHLDLYVMIWQDGGRSIEAQNQIGKRNLIFHPVAFPEAQKGETHCRNLQMGIFEAEGIQAAHGNPAIAFNRFGSQNVHIHPYARHIQAMCISPDNARFYLPPEQALSSFYSACKLPNQRAVAFFGIILDFNYLSPESQAFLNPLHQDDITLRNFKTAIEGSMSVLGQPLINKISKLLTFRS